MTTNDCIINLLEQIIETTSYSPSCFERDGSFSTHRGDTWQMFDTGIISDAKSKGFIPFDFLE